MKVYRNVKTNEFVFKEDAEEYVLDTLGITITPKGKNGEMTQEQMEVIEEIIEWFFSGNWYEDKIENNGSNIAELINEHCYYDDKYLKESRIY